MEHKKFYFQANWKVHKVPFHLTGHLWSSLDHEHRAGQPEMQIQCRARMLYPKCRLMGTDGSFLCHRWQLWVLLNRLWVAEISELFMIVAKNSVCSVAKKDFKKDFKEMKKKRNKGEEFPKRKQKWKFACNKRV